MTALDPRTIVAIMGGVVIDRNSCNVPGAQAIARPIARFRSRSTLRARLASRSTASQMTARAIVTITLRQRSAISTDTRRFRVKLTQNLKASQIAAHPNFRCSFSMKPSAQKTQ